jgi:hypothetical protein
MMSARAVARLEHSTSDSFAIDLKKWHGITPLRKSMMQLGLGLAREG